MSVNPCVRVTFLIVMLLPTGACNHASSTVTESSGLAIKATCKTGGTAARYDEVEGLYPGERTVADPIDGRFLAEVAELPLPCVDQGSDVYRIYQANDTGIVVIGISQSAIGGRLWVVTRPRRAKIRRSERALLRTEWDTITSEILAISFWQQPSRLLEPNREPWRAGWTLEGFRGERYHRISRYYLDDTLNRTAGAFLTLADPLFAKSN